MPSSLTDLDLQQELEDLRRMVLAMQPAGQVRLTAVNREPFLGMPVPVIVSVSDREGLPLIDTPLTLVTTWGTLRTTHELIPQQGTSLSTRTNAQGQVPLLLLPALAEDLLADQQTGLETFLSLLNPTAETPTEATDNLREMAEMYRWEGNLVYRQAIDIYFRDFGQGLLESVNSYDYLQSWSFLNATVLALLQPETEAGESAIAATAALTLRIKNWLGAWLEVYLSHLQAQDELTPSFGIIKDRDSSESILDGMYDRLQDFVDSQQGVVGQSLGRKVAETAVQTFIDGGIDTLPLETRVALAPSLSSASRAISTLGIGGVISLSQSRADLKQGVAAGVVSAVEQASTAANTAIAGLNQTFNQQLGSLTTRFDGLQTNVGTFNEQLGGLSNQLGKLETNQTTLTSSVGTLTTKIDGVQRDQSTLGTKVDTIQRDQGALGTLVDTIQRGQGSLATSLDGLQQTVTTFNSRINTLNTQVTGLQTNVTRLDTNVSRIDTNVTRLDTQVGGFQNRFQTLDTQVGTLNTQVGGFQNRFQTLDTQVGTLNTNLDRFSRASAGRIVQLEDSVTRVGNNVLSIKTDLAKG